MSDDARRRAYWAAQMDAAYAFMRAVWAYPVEECGEPLVPLLPAAADAGVEVAASDRPASNGEQRRFVLRAGLVPAFLDAARSMNARGWVLKLEDCYRTLAMQKYNVQLPGLFAAVMAKTRWECGGAVPDDLFIRRMAALIASAPCVGTHTMGSAMDISVLERDTGAEVDRGASYLEISELTPMGSPFVSRAARRHRQEITALMARHGFVTYPWEFWHYNAGDPFAGYFLSPGTPARYGPVHADAEGRVTPIANPGTLLNTPEEFAALLAQAAAEGGTPCDSTSR